MASMITEKTVQNIIGRRNKEIHKGDCGRIMIAAGSEGMAGAAILGRRCAPAPDSSGRPSLSACFLSFRSAFRKPPAWREDFQYRTLQILMRSA